LGAFISYEENEVYMAPDYHYKVRVALASQSEKHIFTAGVGGHPYPSIDLGKFGEYLPWNTSFSSELSK
jgi:hypothetical protein